MGSGQGYSERGFQLPDIIKAQGELGEKMGQGGQDGEKNGKGREGEKGEGNKDADGQGQDGEGKGKDDGNGGGEVNATGRQEGQSGGGTDYEEEMKELYEIYKQQQMIREALERQLEDMMQEKDRQLARKILNQMENFENELLNQGITERTLSRVNQIEHELLKMENAALKQGKKQERESRVNDKRFQAPILTIPTDIENNGDEIEILTRQALPLHQIFQNMVKKYFERDDRVPVSY
jgi:hypothetical protein